MLDEPGNRDGARHRAEREDELLVADRMGARVGLHRRRAPLEVDALGAAEQELRVRRHHAERHDGVARLDRPDAASGSSGV